MATEQQWEYCQLILSSWYYDANERKWFYNVGIRYFGAQGGYYTLAEYDTVEPYKTIKKYKGWSYNPWQYAIGLLGTGGWEMVSVQHGNFERNIGSGGGGKGIVQDETVAYFKRPIQPGRRVDEPKLVLPQNI
jgi:hypothetical protein